MSLSCLAEAMRSQAGSFNLDHGHQPGLCEWIIGTNGSMDQWIMDNVKNWINGFGLYIYIYDYVPPKTLMHLTLIHGREQRARRALGKTPRSDFWQTMGQGHCFGVVQV
jgi:hypothetical protein